jgi:hypothetical protein
MSRARDSQSAMRARRSSTVNTGGCSASRPGAMRGPSGHWQAPRCQPSNRRPGSREACRRSTPRITAPRDSSASRCLTSTAGRTGGRSQPPAIPCLVGGAGVADRGQLRPRAPASISLNNPASVGSTVQHRQAQIPIGDDARSVAQAGRAAPISTAPLWRSPTVLEQARSFTNVLWSTRLKATGRKYLNPVPLLSSEVDLVLVPLSGVVEQQPDPREVTADLDLDDGAELGRNVPARSPRERGPLLIVIRHGSRVGQGHCRFHETWRCRCEPSGAGGGFFERTTIRSGSAGLVAGPATNEKRWWLTPLPTSSSPARMQPVHVDRPPG